MSEGVARELVQSLIDSLVDPTTESLVLVPAERPACLHVYAGEHAGKRGWTASLDCRRMMSHLLRAIVANSGDGRCAVSWRAHNVDRVTISTSSPALMRRVLDVVIADHRRTCPDARLAAIVLGSDGCAPRRIDVVRPPARRASTAPRRPALALVSSHSPA
ncbi:MAG TPA: hypothetical protein VFJ97_08410 [Dermatophilaceae bacterium]|nr:hypothetical protein [Dermatophilaceae bacterium]